MIDEEYIADFITRNNFRDCFGDLLGEDKQALIEALEADSWSFKVYPPCTIISEKVCRESVSYLPAILFEYDNYVNVFDGNHRIRAWNYLGTCTRAWVGRINRSCFDRLDKGVRRSAS